MPQKDKIISELKLNPKTIIDDYRMAFKRRQASIIGRREVLSGKAKFGIFGDGKEVAQLAMAKSFQKGDFRSGYYRDQTFMFAIGEHKISEFFAQLYADPNIKNEPATAGRSMNAHFATRSLNEDGTWKNLMEIKNSSADISPTGSQMPRLVGLAYASKLYRELEDLKEFVEFSDNGNEVAFGTIGNASCAEGIFWEAINALSVLRAPAVVSIWDDGYGISVSNQYQFSRDLSELLSGFQREEGTDSGFDLYRVPAWDYPALIEAYKKAADTARKEHVPSIIHVVEVTQPQGHSTSGSHERYKSAERLNWEKEYDCIKKFRRWILENEYISENELIEFEKIDIELVEDIRIKAYNDFKDPILKEIADFSDLLDEISTDSLYADKLVQIKDKIARKAGVLRQDILVSAQDALIILREEEIPAKNKLIAWINGQNEVYQRNVSSHLHSNSELSTENVKEVKAIYSAESPMLNGFQIMNRVFDTFLERDSRVLAFGEDVGFLGGVNQGFAGLQLKYGELRVADTGIREATIMGQAIGLALRGFRPIAEIQYLDYLLYALQIMADDLATLLWRTKGGQKAPVIVRTRGHRLEGIWHSGSSMGGILNLVRGMHLLVPRNMVQAAGFYNTLLKSDEPGIVVEVLNGYRLKERLPDNFADYSVPVGIPEIIRSGSDITIVTYGALVRIAKDAAEKLEKVDISVELIDIQSLLPFDVEHRIVESLKKTNSILFLDEDVPGGASAYMMQEVIEKQNGYKYLDSPPATLSAKPHRPAYGSDGGYWSKPNSETIFEKVYEMMHETDPQEYPIFF